jgi:16S rRNA (cytidine1402-2'-O)-methyltransferase
MPGTLYIVATPIGNLEDLTPRAARVLGEVDLILAEDTRRTGKLLGHIDVRCPMRSLHEHNQSEQVDGLVAKLAAGEHLALVSDAGTPMISDPGFPLLRAAIDAGVTVVPVAGACAAIAALSVAGLPTERFTMEGFLSARREGRRKRLMELIGEIRTMVFYESVHRITDCLADMSEVLGAKREACVARELTKMYETIRRGSLAELAAEAATGSFKRGEVVVVVKGADQGAADQGEVRRILNALARELPPSKAAKVAAELTGQPRRELFNLLGASPDGLEED